MKVNLRRTYEMGKDSTFIATGTCMKEIFSKTKELARARLYSKIKAHWLASLSMTKRMVMLFTKIAMAIVSKPQCLMIQTHSKT